MKKKLLSSLLTGAMVIGLLTGCGSTENNEVEKETSVTEGGSESVKEQEQEQEKELDPVRILCVNFQNGMTGMDTYQWEEYAVSKVVIEDLEEIGIKLELELLDSETFFDQINARMAAGTDMPDMIGYSWWGADTNNVLEWAKNGLVYSIDELLEQYDEDGSIRKFYDEKVPGSLELSAATDGKTYWFPNATVGGPAYDITTGKIAQGKNYNPAITIREDWITAVGEERKDVYTLEEFAALLKKMRSEDANGNGIEDEVLYTLPESFYSAISVAFGLNLSTLAGYYEDDNVVFSNFHHENFKAYIEYMNDLYESGVLDPIVLSSTSAEMVSSNVVSAVANDYPVNWVDYLTDENAGYIGAFLDADGDVTNGFSVAVDNYKVGLQGAYFIPTANKNPEPVMRLLDYVFTDEYQMLEYYGIEGVNYEIVNDEYVLPYNEVNNGTFEYTDFKFTGVGFFALPRVWATKEARKSKTVEEYDFNTFSGRAQYWSDITAAELIQHADREVFALQMYAMATEEEQTFLDEKTNLLTTYATELLTDLILGNKSVDDLPEYIAELDELGLKKYVEIMQARRDRVLGK